MRSGRRPRLRAVPESIAPRRRRGEIPARPVRKDGALPLQRIEMESLGARRRAGGKRDDGKETDGDQCQGELYYPSRKLMWSLVTITRAIVVQRTHTYSYK
jgi:hypothetical protein